MKKLEHNEWSFEFEEAGNHTHIKVRVGTSGSRGLAGSLVMSHPEAAIFADMVTAQHDLERVWEACNAEVGDVGMEATTVVDAIQSILETARQQGRDEEVSDE